MAVVGRVTVCFFIVTLYFVILICQVCTFNLEPRLPVIKVSSDNESYFGYSVAQHQVLDESNKVIEQVLLIGAPRAQTTQPGTERSGAVYRCSLNTLRGDCTQLQIDQSNFEPDPSTKKDDQWMGVTVKSQGSGKYVLACAHRYVINGSDFQWGNGVCYSLTQFLDLHREWQPCLNRPVNKAHEQYGYCQAGTSGELSEDNNIIIGTPGPYTWRGTVFTNTVSFKIRDDKTWYMGPLADDDFPVDKYSYLGMSVTSGKFFGSETVFVGGAPRSNGTGQVVFFTKKNNPEFAVRLILNGEQFASSFGYTLASLDLNSDGYIDLVVGAPFYYGKDEGGAIYIYLNSEEGLNATTNPIKLTGKKESRFGFAIANAGDINKDGYTDLAVGAPYEGQGAVYIYLGSSKGIRLEPSQIIRVEDLPYELENATSFGYSLSGGMDMDSNGYPDLLVGAYNSSTIVLLRSRPIINIHTLVRNKLKNIDPSVLGCPEDPESDLICFSFEPCFQFNSSVLSHGTNIKLNYRIEAETFTGKKHFRTIFKSSANESNIVTKDIFIEQDSLDEEHCFREVVHLKNKTDIQNPIKFKLTYSLLQEEPVMPEEGDRFPDINRFPILNQVEASKIFEIKFLKDCGTNELCECDLHLEAELNLQLKKNKYIFHVGEKHVNMSFKIQNRNESAYDAALYIFHSPSLTYGNNKIIKGDPINCLPEERYLKCELSNPMKVGDIEGLIWFNARNVLPKEKRLKFSAKVNTTSIELTEEDDLEIEAEVITVAELELRGGYVEEQVFYGGKVVGETGIQYLEDIGNAVDHIYELTNKGPWSATEVRIEVRWPYEIANNGQPGKWILYITESPTIIGNGFCDISKTQVNPLDYKKKPDMNLTYENGTIIEKGLRRRKKREIIKPEELRMDGNIVQAVTMDCDKGTAKCYHFDCYIRDLEANKQARIIIKSRLWSSTFISDYRDVEMVRIISRAEIKLNPALGIQQSNLDDDIADVVSKVYPDKQLYQKAEEVPLWIIILAACGGVLLLIIVIVCLWKFGFFKRKKPGYILAETSDKEKEANNI